LLIAELQKYGVDNMDDKKSTALQKWYNIIFFVALFLTLYVKWVMIVAVIFWLITTIALIMNDKKNGKFDFFTILLIIISIALVFLAFIGLLSLKNK
jgi:ABC-type Fe3+-siderophore transport system permease subunit